MTDGDIPENFDLWLHREAGGDTPWVGGFVSGAAVAFGLMGMAEAIRANASPLVERSYWTDIWGEGRYDCFCPGCGAFMKGCTPGKDEGTLSEWCGACRY